MSQASSKKSFGFYIVLLAIALTLAAGIYFIVIHGTFGLANTHNGDCYDPLIVYLLIGGAGLTLILTLIKRYGLASAVSAAVPGAGICLFAHKCYWYVTDVFMGIDEVKFNFDPRFIIFSSLIAAAFVIGEVAIYVKKTKA